MLRWIIINCIVVSCLSTIKVSDCDIIRVILLFNLILLLNISVERIQNDMTYIYQKRENLRRHEHKLFPDPEE